MEYTDKREDHIQFPKSLALIQIWLSFIAIILTICDMIESALECA